MSGPVLAIEVAQAVPSVALQQLREYLLGASARFEERRVGEYDLNIHAESLGITDAGDVDGGAPAPGTRRCLRLLPSRAQRRPVRSTADGRQVAGGAGE